MALLVAELHWFGYPRCGVAWKGGRGGYLTCPKTCLYTFHRRLHCLSLGLPRIVRKLASLLNRIDAIAKCPFPWPTPVSKHRDDRPIAQPPIRITLGGSLPPLPSCIARRIASATVRCAIKGMATFSHYCPPSCTRAVPIPVPTSDDDSVRPAFPTSRSGRSVQPAATPAESFPRQYSPTAGI